MNRRAARLAFFISFAVALAADRATKLWALSALPQASPGAPFFSLGLRFNRGISFSLFEGSAAVAWLAPLMGAAILVLLTLRCERLRATPACALLWAGMTGNAADRLLYGHVIDWFRVGLYVNLADVFLCLGAFLLAIAIWNQRSQG